MHVIAAKAVAFGEALKPEFKIYAKNVVENAKALAEALKCQRPGHRLRRHRHPPDAGGPASQGRQRQVRPKRRSTAPPSPATRTPCPSIPEKPFVTSGIRLGTPAGTTRGFGTAEFREIGKLIVEVVDGRGQEHEDGRCRRSKQSVRAPGRRTVPPLPDLS